MTDKEFVMHLLGTPPSRPWTISAVARAAGISRNVIYYWLHRDSAEMRDPKDAAKMARFVRRQKGRKA